MSSFDFTWKEGNGGSKAPHFIIFPDGVEKQVQNMRYGLIRFHKAGTATYERKGPYSITVTPIETAEQMRQARLNYMAKQRRKHAGKL